MRALQTVLVVHAAPGTVRLDDLGHPRTRCVARGRNAAPQL